MCQSHCGLPQRCLSASFVTSVRERQIMNTFLFIIFNLSIFCNWGRIQVRELAFSLVFWIGFSITSTGLVSVGMRWLLEESGLLAGLVDAWTGAELAGKLPDSVVGGKAPLPFTAPFTPKKKKKSQNKLIGSYPTVLKSDCTTFGYKMYYVSFCS